jgi:hypothetical protein
MNIRTRRIDEAALPTIPSFRTRSQNAHMTRDLPVKPNAYESGSNHITYNCLVFFQSRQPCYYCLDLVQAQFDGHIYVCHF